MVASYEIKDNYLKSLFKEAEIKKLDNISFKTLYIGGGTPSSLSLNQLDFLLNGLSKYIDFTKLEEFTIEANPLDINDDFIDLIMKYHINRLSIGIQSFNNQITDLIKRKIDINDFNKIISILNNHHFINYSFDLMYGFINQTTDDIKKDLDILINAKPKHISLYALIIEDKTIFKYQRDHGINFEASDDEQAKMYNFISSYLFNYGYKRYETSNFSIEGYESKHNLIYWNYDNYYSLGIGATQIVNGVEETMDVNITNYISSLANNKIPKHYIKELNEEQILFDYAMVNLRKSEGINKDIFKSRFNKDVKSVYLNINNLLKKEYLLENDKSIFINPKYVFVENSIIVDTIDKIKV